MSHNYYSVVLPHTLTGWLLVGGMFVVIVAAWLLPYEGRAWVSRREAKPYDWTSDLQAAAEIESLRISELAPRVRRLFDETVAQDEARAQAALYEEPRNVVPLPTKKNTARTV